MAATTRKSTKRRWTATGSAAIEFGLATPILLALLMGVVELGFTMYQAMQVYNSVEAGAIYAAKNGFDADRIADAVRDATATPHIEATPAPMRFWGCPGATGIVETTPGATCDDGKPAGQYVRISAALERETILPYPALDLPTTLTAQSVVRLN